MFLENRKGTKSYFVKKGIVRAYTHKDDKDITFWLGQEGDLIFPLQTLFAGLGEYTNVELLEDCVLYEIDLEQLQSLYYTDIHIANWGRKYAEYACIKSEKLFIARQFKTSLERYQELINEYPSITQRVQLGIVASYLGISQVNLSRIRAQIK
ncbi:cyclic nucleotide-binding domain protein [Parabacteroides distasonis str. 3999B T(B) 6]|nr:cyclic nucleotide-binding domain protein [Parabacteroides distasonis str. 3999B T(B) 6]KDS74685.1 cyclic nucleotide-binding domain protein [Parabacteroides distasonis str. 3999B T(B) 4]